MAHKNLKPQDVGKNNLWIYISMIAGFLMNFCTLGWIPGFIGLSVVKDDSRVRFQCAQAATFYLLLGVLIDLMFVSTLAFGISGDAWIIKFVFAPAFPAIFMLGFIAAIAAIVLTARGRDFRIPLLAGFAEKHVMKLFDKNGA